MIVEGKETADDELEGTAMQIVISWSVKIYWWGLEQEIMSYFYVFKFIFEALNKSIQNFNEIFKGEN